MRWVALSEVRNSPGSNWIVNVVDVKFCRLIFMQEPQYVEEFLSMVLLALTKEALIIFF